MPNRKESSARKPAPKTAARSKDASGERAPAAAYSHFLPAAKEIPDGEVVVCRADVSLLLHNVQLGVEAVKPQAGRLKKELPALGLEALWELPELAGALVYAADQVGGPASKAEVANKLARVRQLREPMLLIAEGLALLGLLPGEKVTAIRSGSGALDAARDGIALEALYRESAAAIRGKHPFTAADLKEAAELGAFLLRSVTPDGGRARAEAPSEAAVSRDRLYTLVLRRHAELRKAGFYLFGEAVDTYVPLLQSRLSRKKAEPAQPASPQPVAP